ncbi:long-chain acyl-[acyl-carrier-protein] reductase [Synechococcus elongatus]|uniref:Long-chain acyl-[acyl-carrier-protein] reductase n=1 Tax=Synechococcus elongatus PCC 11802 TaxID=2283154 RepID=A0AAT9JTF5_SYNEL|nr:long-chain acyl-[acyl-carrier-protein] reductase [Synechococcus elongatus]QFZ92573.1 long-chain acyl-[acyl-carrier-protein] reductase [Synechococcus elongatus PCC 11802]
MFGLIGHLTSLEQACDVARSMGYEEYADQGLEFWSSAPPQIVDEITVTSATGKVIHGRYIESCFLPEMLAARRFKTATRKVLNAMSHAQKHGIDISALGGFTSIIFENFDLASLRQVRDTTLEFERFTTGNTHTAYIICKQVETSAQQLGLDLTQATIAVVGATGDIGSAVCRWLDRKLGVGDLILTARNQERLDNLQAELGRGKILPLETALPEADIIVWVASMPQGVTIDPTTLKQPCVLIDGGYPKNLGSKVQGDGIYVLNGGVVEHCFDIDWQIMSAAEMARPERQMFACFAEAMLLEFEGWHTNFSWGRNQITIEKMEAIGEASRRHGFQPLALAI